jgi:hypothetical protein
MRPDRDNYVKINWENIREGMAYNFDSFGSDRINSRGSTYDYKSIMHYGSYGFSINGQPTMVDLNGNPIDVQDYGMAQTDQRIHTNCLLAADLFEPFRNLARLLGFHLNLP